MLESQWRADIALPSCSILASVETDSKQINILVHSEELHFLSAMKGNFNVQRCAALFQAGCGVSRRVS